MEKEHRRARKAQARKLKAEQRLAAKVARSTSSGAEGDGGVGANGGGRGSASGSSTIGRRIGELTIGLSRRTTRRTKARLIFGLLGEFRNPMSDSRRLTLTRAARVRADRARVVGNDLCRTLVFRVVNPGGPDRAQYLQFNAHPPLYLGLVHLGTLHQSPPGLADRRRHGCVWRWRARSCRRRHCRQLSRGEG